MDVAMQVLRCSGWSLGCNFTASRVFWVVLECCYAVIRVFWMVVRV